MMLLWVVVKPNFYFYYVQPGIGVPPIKSTVLIPLALLNRAASFRDMNKVARQLNERLFKRWSLKLQQKDLALVLDRPVEAVGESGRSPPINASGAYNSGGENLSGWHAV